MFFFFQAEDGIRDKLVTGVQTCALPILRRETGAEVAQARRSFALAQVRLERDRRLLASADRLAAMSLQAYAEGAIPPPHGLEGHPNARAARGPYITDGRAAKKPAPAVPPPPPTHH